MQSVGHLIAQKDVRMESIADGDMKSLKGAEELALIFVGHLILSKDVKKVYAANGCIVDIQMRLIELFITNKIYRMKINSLNVVVRTLTDLLFLFN